MTKVKRLATGCSSLLGHALTRKTDANMLAALAALSNVQLCSNN